MHDALGEAKEGLARKIDSHSTPSIKPIGADPWVVSSLLQKSIRRGAAVAVNRLLQKVSHVTPRW
jgi:hypothetical protein